jgi:hypothetical protein
MTDYNHRCALNDFTAHVYQAHIFPGFEQGGFTWRDPERQDLNEVYALSYDGAAFRTERTGAFTQHAAHVAGLDPLELGGTGWALLTTGITNAIADDEDLLLPVSAVRVDRAATAVGVARWAHQHREWRVVDFEPVVTSLGDTTAGDGDRRTSGGTPSRGIEACPWMEPSLARCGDGRLLFSARGQDTPRGVAGSGASGFVLQVWRGSADEQQLATPQWRRHQWGVVLSQPDERLNSPVTVNTTGNSAYLVSSPYDGRMLPERDQTGRGREKIVLWPLFRDSASDSSEASDSATAAATASNAFKLGDPQLIRDCLESFGPPPQTPKRPGAAPVVGDDGGVDPPEKWMADHANGAVCRLATGWRAVLAYRVCHSPRYRCSGTLEPSKHSGAFVVDLGAVYGGGGGCRRPWRFASDDEDEDEETRAEASSRGKL